MYWNTAFLNKTNLCLQDLCKPEHSRHVVVRRGSAMNLALIQENKKKKNERQRRKKRDGGGEKMRRKALGQPENVCTPLLRNPSHILLQATIVCKQTH